MKYPGLKRRAEIADDLVLGSTHLVRELRSLQTRSMTTQAEQLLEVSRATAADPATIFALLREPSGHVAIDASGMLMGTTGDAPQAVGDTFVVHMDRDALRDFDIGEYDVVEFVTYEPDREIAWTVGRPPVRTSDTSTATASSPSPAVLS